MPPVIEPKPSNVTEPKPSNVIDFRKVLEDARAKSNKVREYGDEVTQEGRIRDGIISIVDCRLKVSTAMSFENDLPDTHTDKVWIVCHSDKREDGGETILGAINIEAPMSDDMLLDMILQNGLKKDVVLTPALRSHGTAYKLWNSAVDCYDYLDDETHDYFKQNPPQLEPSPFRHIYVEPFF